MTDKSDAKVFRLAGPNSKKTEAEIGSIDWAERFEEQARKLTDFEWHGQSQEPREIRVSSLESLQAKGKSAIRKPVQDESPPDNVASFPGKKA